MTWYQWLIGGAEFVITWWATDALTSPQVRAKRKAHAERPKAEPKYLKANGVLLCRHCGTRAACSIYPNGDGPMCRRCVIEDRERGNPPPPPSALDFSRYEPSPVYGALSAVQGVLEAKALDLSQEYLETVLRTQMRLR